MAAGGTRRWWRSGSSCARSREAAATTIATRALLVAGALVGAAAGGKLTAATFAVALCVALLVRFPLDRSTLRERVRQAFWFGIGVLVGLAVTLGPWAIALWRHFENPVFPYFNQWFQSPWWEPGQVLGRAYGPRNVGEWLVFPFNLFGPGEGFVTEVPYRDARFPTAWTLTLAGAAAWLSYRASGRPMPVVPPQVSAAWRIVATFMVIAFLLWTAQYSIFRYIVTLEMLTGAIVVTMLQRLMRPGYLAGVACTIAILLIATTRFGDWWHIDFGEQWFDAKVPRIDRDAMVLMTAGVPVGYVLPLLPEDARHVAVWNNVTAPGRKVPAVEGRGGGDRSASRSFLRADVRSGSEDRPVARTLRAGARSRRVRADRQPHEALFARAMYVDSGRRRREPDRKAAVVDLSPYPTLPFPCPPPYRSRSATLSGSRR